MRISDWSSDVCSSDLFDGEFQVLSWRPVGTQHLKLELGLPGVRLQAIEFGGWTGTPPASRVRVAYRLSPDDYPGGDAIQLVVVNRESLDGVRGSGDRLRRGAGCSFGLGEATLAPDPRPQNKRWGGTN